MLRAVPIMCLLLFSGACLELIVTTEFSAAFDELEHISYAAYLQETGRLLPRFETPFAKSWGGQSPAIGMCKAVEHEADRGQGDHRLGDLG